MDKNIALSKAYFLILIRFILLFCCMVVLFIQRSLPLPNLFTLNESKLLAIYMVFNIVYILLARLFYQKINIFLLIQIGTDLLVVTTLIYLTGGIFSVYISLYFCPILAAGILITSTIAFVYASLATIGISLVTLAYFLAAITNTKLPWVGDQILYPFLEHDYPFLRSYLLAQGLSFHLVALFIHWLTDVMNRQRILHDEILHNLVDGVLVLDNKKNIVFINQSAKDMLELSSKESYYSRALSDLLVADSQKKMWEILQKQSSLKIEIELPYRGKILPIVLTKTAFVSKKEIQAYIIIFHDISDQKGMEEALKRAHRLKTISEVASTISHEIRNPLASIRGAIQELRNCYSPEDEKYLLMDIALRESDRLNRIVADFLSFSKVRQPNLESIHLNHLLEEFLFFVKKREDMAQSEITMQIEDNLWILGDVEQIKQIFYNLTTNALESAIDILHLKITAASCLASKLPHTITPSNLAMRYLEQNTEDIGVMIQISDQGRGIDPKLIPKIFSPFFTTKERGTGMGLAMVSKILDMHQGFYSFESQVNQGATFSMWLPSPKKVKSIDSSIQ